MEPAAARRGDTLDEFAHMNPAFGAFVLHHVCRGYEHATTERVDAFRNLSPTWGMLALALLAPTTTRDQVPGSKRNHLSVLLTKHPEWRNSAPLALRMWADPFWKAVSFGLATGSITIKDGRIAKAGRLKVPTKEPATTLRRKADVLGALLANEESDDRLSLLFGVVLAA